MFSEIREVRRNEKIKSEKERELDRLWMQVIDERMYTDEWHRLMREIEKLEATTA